MGMGRGFRGQPPVVLFIYVLPSSLRSIIDEWNHPMVLFLDNQRILKMHTLHICSLYWWNIITQHKYYIMVISSYSYRYYMTCTWGRTLCAMTWVALTPNEEGGLNAQASRRILSDTGGLCYSFAIQDTWLWATLSPGLELSDEDLCKYVRRWYFQGHRRILWKPSDSISKLIQRT